MIVITVSMVKDEEIMIESSVRYWLTFSDRVIVFDHHSTDGTPAILNALKEEFSYRLILFYPDFETVDYVQEDVTNAMIASALMEYNADIVLPLEADEYPFMLKKGNIRDFLTGLDQSYCYSSLWIPFAPLRSYENLDLSKMVPLSFSRRKDKALQQWPKVIITGKIWREDPVFVTKGNHQLYRLPGKKGPVVVSLCPELYYAHFMYRDASHFKSKVATHWIADYSSENYFDTSEHCKLACKKILEGKLTEKIIDHYTVSVSGMTGESMEDSEKSIITVDPKDFFPDIPLFYTDKFCTCKGEFVKLLETTLNLADRLKKYQTENKELKLLLEIIKE